MEQKSFPFEKATYNGKEYISMKSDIFYSFFREIIKYKNTYPSITNEICKQYEYAKRIKKKRIKLKKEKEALLRMYDFILVHYLKSF